MKTSIKANIGLCSVSLIFLASISVLAFQGTGSDIDPTPAAAPVQVPSARPVSSPINHPSASAQQSDAIRFHVAAVSM
ncbi:MAG TPA: hypothetical protein VL992_16760 [Tepidisphaeraceae bacterium]|nr:hypothetical protein [Tepidisphaeraceae bacterium]